MYVRQSPRLQNLIPTQFVRSESLSPFPPPIIRDRAGAIRPDLSVCVESSLDTLPCEDLHDLSSACLFRSHLESRKGAGALSLGFSGRRSAAVSCCAFFALLRVLWCVGSTFGSHRTFQISYVGNTGSWVFFFVQGDLST